MENTTYIKLVFYKMKNPQSRLRIYSIMFGYGLVYYNDSVMSSALDSYVSPIGADVPQFDFSGNAEKPTTTTSMWITELGYQLPRDRTGNGYYVRLSDPGF